MRLLVTGGAGFIGSNFIKYWFTKYPDDSIVCLDLFTYAGNISNIQEFLSKPNFVLIKGDICDRELVTVSMRNCDYVANFAAESHVDRSIIDPSAFVRTNVLGTQVLLDVARAANIKRFHHVSTDEVFGSLDLNDPSLFNESSLLAPNSPYSASKASSDLIVRSYFKTYGLPVTVSNTSNNYGPYQYPEKLIPLVILNALHNKKIPVYGDGLNVRDWIHVNDHCRAIDLILRDGKIGETYCVGGDAEYPNISIIKLILSLMNKNESLIEFVKDRAGHDRRYAIDSSKIKTELGFKLEYNFMNGIEQTVKWYLENEAWWRPLSNEKYQEYYKKQYEDRK